MGSHAARERSLSHFPLSNSRVMQTSQELPSKQSLCATTQSTLYSGSSLVMALGYSSGHPMPGTFLSEVFFSLVLVNLVYNNNNKVKTAVKSVIDMVLLHEKLIKNREAASQESNLGLS